MSSQKSFPELPKDATLLEDDYEICRKKIDWKTIPNDVLNQDEVNKLQSLEGSGDEILAPENDLHQIFSDKETALKTMTAFIKVLEIRKPDQLAYILTLLSHILQQEPSRAQTFLHIDKFFLGFWRTWSRNDVTPYTAGKAAICAAYILRYANDENKYLEEHTKLCGWVIEQSKSKVDKLLYGLHALKTIVHNPIFQKLFVDQNGVNRLFEILTNNGDNRQVAYLVIFCLWTLSFQNRYANHDGLLNGQLLSKLVKYVQDNRLHNLKLTRVIFYFFENLLNKENFNEMVCLFGLYPTLESLKEEKINDEELKGSILNLMEHLAHVEVSLSSFERYEQEIRSDKLAWGPCHTDTFWKKYAFKFEDEDYKLIRAVINLLGSREPETVAVACYDLGQFSQFYQDGKRVIEKLNGKVKLMTLIEHNNAEVRKQALTAVQKLLIKHWEDLDDSKDTYEIKPN